MTNENGPSLRELERDAERNRALLMETVDALQQRISPAAIKHEVKDYVRGKRDSFLDTLGQTARDNPVQTVAIAAGAAYPLWGILSRIPAPLLLIGAGFALTRRSSNGTVNGGAYGVMDEAASRLGNATDAVRQKLDDVSLQVEGQVRQGMRSARGAAGAASGYAVQASEAATTLAADLGERASGGADALRAMGHDAAALAGEMPERMKRAGSQANDWLKDTVRDNPLIVGGLGLAVGAIIAAALPSTPQESRLLGSAADDLKRKAGEAALEGVEMAKDLADDVYAEVGGRAQEQGLSADRGTEFAGQVGDKVKAVVASVTGDSEEFGNQHDYSPRTTSGATG